MYLHYALGLGGAVAVRLPVCCFFSGQSCQTNVLPSLSHSSGLSLSVLVEPYLLRAAVTVCWQSLPLLLLLSTVQRSQASWLSTQILSFVFCSAEILLPQLPQTTPLPITVLFVLCMSNFCLPSSFHPPPSLSCVHRAYSLLPSPSCTPCIHPTFSPPTGLSPPCLPPAPLSTCIPPLISRTCLPPLAVGAGRGALWGQSETLSLIKLRFRRAENGEGQQSWFWWVKNNKGKSSCPTFIASPASNQWFNTKLYFE